MVGPGMFDDLGKGLIIALVISIILSVGLWELLQWIFSHIEISISWS